MSDPNPLISANPSSGNVEVSELKAMCAALDSQAHNLRIGLLIVASVLLAFFFRESKYNNSLAERTEQQAAQVSKFEQSLEKQGTSLEKEYDKQSQTMQGVVNRLVEFSKTHPDYVPILTKHGIPTTSNQPEPVPAKPTLVTPKK